MASGDAGLDLPRVSAVVPPAVDVDAAYDNSTKRRTRSLQSEMMRYWFTLVLLGAFVVLMIMAMIGAFASKAQVRDVAELFLVPLVGFIGVALGFYFAKERQ
jgi:cytochrome bd-type quinol oxidase subunit 2